MRTILFALVVFLMPVTAQEVKTVPAINEIELWQQVGQQPYEFTWVQREEDPRALVGFEDMKGWTLELHAGARGELRRSREQQMWGAHVAKVVYSGTGDESRVVARPPAPVPIPGYFDSIDLWGYGNRWSWVADPTTPAADVSILVTDARAKEHRIQLTNIQWKQWWLIHRRIPANALAEIVWPAAFSGIEIAKASNKDPRYFFCDSLTFYTEELKPLQLMAQPKRNLKPFRGQIVGLNTGPGTLPFPTREETILPENFEREYEITARETAPNQFEFTYKGRDATVIYNYSPAKGVLGEIRVRVDDGAPYRPLDGGGIRFSGAPEGEVAQGELLSARLNGNAVEARFRMSSRIVDYQIQLWGKSLVLDAWCDGGEAAEFRFGKVAGVANPRLISVPYLTYGGAFIPRVLLSGSAAKPVFTSVWFDWYRTNASAPFISKEPQLTGDSAEINGGMQYLAKTDGTRNNLSERIFITASPNYEEVLPTIANPPSLRQEEGKQVLWTVSQPSSFKADHETGKRIRSYGLDKIMQHSHEVTWRDEGDSNTLKLHASPQKGGDAALKWYVAAQNEMGWLQGVYSNYTDFCTVNSNWNPDHVMRAADGEWKRAWPRNYALKPSKAVEFNEYYAKRIKEKFGVKMSYTDVHTAVSPWNFCDFDARVPGAGTMAATFYAYGQLMLNDQRVYGPTQSEATYQWLYAGLASGNYGWAYTDLNLLKHPLDVAFMLRKIHPLDAEYGMGYTHFYLEGIDPKWRDSPKRREYVDLFLATAIGYGNMGWLVREFGISDPFGIEVMTRSYYMMQQLQQQYAFVRPKTIEYGTRDGRLIGPGQAHATGEIANSRLRVVYENGTEVFVNRASSGNWNVKDHKGTNVELPPSGWLAFNPTNGFHEVSGNLQGRRIDYVHAAEYEFLDGRGTLTQYGGLAAAGSVALRRKAPDVLELTDLYGNERIRFAAKSGGTLIAYDPDGKSLGPVPTATPEGGWVEFQTLPGARRYVYAPNQ